MRDGLIEDMRDYIVAMQTFGCSVNWQHGLDVAITVDRKAETMTVSDAFADHKGIRVESLEQVQRAKLLR